MNYSIYLVGSKARGDHTSASDVDYVCIYDDEKPIILMSENENMSYYSFQRMRWMVNNSKLFVKHILLDGIAIVEQENHKLLLESFTLKKNILSNDLDQFVRLANELKWIPPGRIGYRWACDYIYTLCRNIVYITNSLESKFEFGYESAVREFLVKQQKISLLSDFLEIRAGKYRYRSGSEDQEHPHIEVIDRVLSTLIQCTTHLKVGGTSLIAKNNSISYATLRMIERAIINGEIQDDHFIEKFKNHGEYFFLLRKQAYSLLNQL